MPSEMLTNIIIEARHFVVSRRAMNRHDKIGVVSHPLYPHPGISIIVYYPVVQYAA